jgi:hypothetical protein
MRFRKAKDSSPRTCESSISEQKPSDKGPICSFSVGNLLMHYKTGTHRRLQQPRKGASPEGRPMSTKAHIFGCCSVNTIWQFIRRVPNYYLILGKHARMLLWHIIRRLCTVVQTESSVPEVSACDETAVRLGWKFETRHAQAVYLTLLRHLRC